MSTAQGPAPRRDGATAARTVVGRLAGSYLLQFLAFAAALSVVVVLLARAPEDCDCGSRTAQVVLFALAGLLAVVGTVLQASAAGPSYARSEPGDPTGRAADRGRTGAVLVGIAVLLIAVAGLVALW